jgi:hypothetical protein
VLETPATAQQFTLNPLQRNTVNLSPEVTQKEDTRAEPTEERLRAAAAFDQIFGPNALEFQRRQENAEATRTVQIVHPFNQNHNIDLEVTGAEDIPNTTDRPADRSADRDFVAEHEYVLYFGPKGNTTEMALLFDPDGVEDADPETRDAAARIKASAFLAKVGAEPHSLSSLFDANKGDAQWRDVELRYLDVGEQGQRDLLVAQTINEAQENGDLRVGTDQQTVVAVETNEVVEEPTDKEIKSALAARSALETERQNILVEAQTPHEVGLDGALKSYVNGRADAYNNIRNTLAESSAVELPNVIEPEELSVIPPTLEIDDRQQTLQLAL